MTHCCFTLKCVLQRVFELHGGISTSMGDIKPDIASLFFRPEVAC